jgi:hypothetical protein
MILKRGAKLSMKYNSIIASQSALELELLGRMTRTER